MKILSTPRMERCIGCHSCSLACARLVHKQLSWDKAGIRIQSTGGLSTGFEAKPCLACDPVSLQSFSSDPFPRAGSYFFEFRFFHTFRRLGGWIPSLSPHPLGGSL
jgi:hypothetical protein